MHFISSPVSKGALPPMTIPVSLAFCRMSSRLHPRLLGSHRFSISSSCRWRTTDLACGPSTHASSMFRNTALASVKGARYLSSGSKRDGTTFLQRFLGPKEIPPRWTPRWYGEMLLLCTVFAITGSSTMVLVRPAMTTGLGLKGNLKDGPWSYRICSIVIMTPLYASLLVVVGTVFGRHFYFKHFAVKMFSRFGIPPELMDKNFARTSKNFRKY